MGTALILIAAGVFILGAITLQGLAYVPAKPPHVGLLTHLGERTTEVTGEGLGFFLFRGFLTDFIPINVSKVDIDFKPADVRTPDLAELEIPISIAYTPGAPKGIKDPNEGRFLLNFLNYGGVDGVKDRLEDIVAQVLRQWAQNPDKKPRNWREALGSQDEVTVELLHKILGTEGQTTTPEEIAKLRNGDAMYPLISLGITIHRLNVTNIKPLGEVAKAAENAAKEELEKKGEVVEMQARIDQANLLVTEARKVGVTYKFEDAIAFVMSYRSATEGGRSTGIVIPGLPEVAKAILESLGGSRGRRRR